MDEMQKLGAYNNLRYNVESSSSRVFCDKLHSDKLHSSSE